MKGVYIFMAEGFEEIEAITTLDVLRRGGVDVKVVSNCDCKTVTGAHGLAIESEYGYGEFKALDKCGATCSEDALIFPGGMPGTRNLAENEELMELMKCHYEEGGTVAAICAAPGLVVSQLPCLNGKKFTCYDGFDEAPAAKGGEYVKAPAVSDGNLITGRGPGCAVEFALAVLAHLKGEECAREVAAGMLFNAS